MASMFGGLKDESTKVLLKAWKPVARTRGGAFASDTLVAIKAVVHGFLGERISLRAAALTFVSIFSLVPMLTVALGILQKLHQREFQAQLRTFINDVLAPGIREESAALLERFLTSAASSAAGGIGVVMLLVSAGMLLHNLDASLNEIWDVRRSRPLALSVALYFLVLTVGPLLLATSLAGSANLKSLLLTVSVPFVRELVAFGGFLAAVGGFTLLYKIAPNAPVRWRSALSGGLVAGTAWEIARVAYSTFAALSFRFNPIYGSLGAAPLFLVWIYLSWLLVLFGARLSYAVEHARMRGVLTDLGTHPRARELIATRLAQLITACFERGLPAPTPRELSRSLAMPGQRVNEVLDLLLDAGLLTRAGRRGGLSPGREPSRLTLADISAAVGGVAKLRRQPAPSLKGSEYEEVEALFAAADDASAARLESVTWSHIATRLEAAGTVAFERVEPSPTAQGS